MSDFFAVGVDLGGTEIKSAIVRHDGRIERAASTETRAHQGPGAVLDTIAQQVRGLVGESGLDRRSIVGLGIGSPGPLSHKRGLVYRAANLPGWDHVPIAETLARHCDLPTVLHNDANAAAFGEFWAGTGRAGGHQDLVLLTLGTGVGSGVILEGRLLQGHFENAGEIGHMIVVPDGRACPCGQRGCLEQYASAASVPRRYRERAGSAPSGVVGEFDARHVVVAMEAGDTRAASVWDETCRFLALACVNIQHVYNPTLIALGGGMSAAGEILIEGVKRHFRAMQWTLAEDFPQIEGAILGNNAGVIGAAGLAFEAFRP